jgi:hypothetical protein
MGSYVFGFENDVIVSKISIRQDYGGIPHEMVVMYQQVSNVTLIVNHHEINDHRRFSDSTTFFPRSNIRNIGNGLLKNGRVAVVDSCVTPSVSSIDFVFALSKRDIILKSMSAEIEGIGGPTFLLVLKASHTVTTSMGGVNAVISI